jgi:predicted ABC-type ATPase
MKFSNKPQLFIITGSNGAGKSTYKQALLPAEFGDLEIFDGDIFYTRKSSEFYKINKSSKESRKLAEEALEEEFLRLVELSIHQKSNFAYEGHFTGSGAWNIPKRFKQEGFEIHLIFCGLNSPVRSIQRVEMRVKKGGFHVTPLAIENNYYGNMEMLDRNFQMFNSDELIDTSNIIIPIGKLEFGIPVSVIPSDQIPKWLKIGMPVIFKAINVFDIKNNNP